MDAAADTDAGAAADAGGVDAGGVDATPDRPHACWDPAAAFSVTENPAGPWTFGSDDGGRFVVFDQLFDADDPIEAWYTGDGLFDHGLVGKNTGPQGRIWAGTTFIQGGALMMHPGGLAAAAVARWSAPWPGKFAVEGWFEGLSIHPNPSTTTDVHVLAAGRALVDGLLNAAAMGNSLSFGVRVELAPPATIDFTVGPGANGNAGYDLTGLTVRICETD